MTSMSRAGQTIDWQPVTGRYVGAQWQPVTRVPRQHRPSPALQGWLLDEGSLTARLIALSHGDFYVEVLRQKIMRPGVSERRCLKMKRHELALVREVILHGDHQPWIFARSVLPLSSLTGRLRHLRKQGTQPLGAFLFNQTDLVRSEIAVRCLGPEHVYVPAPLCGELPLWGRRSVFYLDQKPLLVSEVFLSDLIARIESTQNE